MKKVFLAALILSLNSDQMFAETISCRSLIEVFSRTQFDRRKVPADITKAVETFIKEKVKEQPLKWKLSSLLAEINLAALMMEIEKKGFPDSNLEQIFIQLRESDIFTVTSGGIHTSNGKLRDLNHFLHETIIHMVGRRLIDIGPRFELKWIGEWSEKLE